MAEKVCNLNKIGGGMSGTATQLAYLTANGTNTIPSINGYSMIILEAVNGYGSVSSQVLVPSMVNDGIETAYYLRTTWSNKEATIRIIFNSATSVTISDKTSDINGLRIIGVN